MADQIRATPRNPFFGLFSDVVNAPLSYMSDPRRTQQMQGVASFLRSTGVPATLENLSYDPSGRNLFTGAGGLGGTTRLRPEVAEAALTVAPFVGPAAKVGVRGAMATGRALGPTAARMAEGYLQRQRLMPGVVPDQTGLLGVVQKPQAPVSDLGFYSAAEQAAMNLQRSKGTGQSFLNDLMKAPDVKKDELQYTGLDEFLKDKPNVTRQEVTDYLSKNKVDVQEVQLGAQDFSKLPDIQLQKEYERIRGYKPLDTYGDLISRDQIISELSGAPATDLTKFSQYTLPGGENYREILLKLPVSGRFELDAAQQKAGVLRRQTADLMEQWKSASELNPRDAGNAALYQKVAESRKLRDQAEAEAQSLQGQIKSQTYQSSHFDEPNILAHMRVNDRVDADGKKMLLVEEIQSDWLQAGREKGFQRKDLTPDQIELKYIPPNVPKGQDPSNYPGYYEAFDKNTGDFVGRHSGSLNQEQAMRDAVSSANQFKTGVPDAPFKDNWYQLSLKRLVKYAADNGYDRIGLTTGRQQAERFDLSKQVDYIDYRTSGSGPKTQYELAVVGKNGDGVDLPKKFFTAEELPNVVGKEVADKIISGQGQAGGGRMTLRGLDLQVGGEGMKKYYDEIYPKYLEKYGKKFDAKVGETRIKTGNAYAQTKGIPAEETVRYIDITPKMKEGTSKGQPLFAAVPAGTLVGGEIDYSDPFGNTIDDTTR
jgi:hypothetical protein